MDIYTLQCFLTLAHDLNYTKAAEKEHITQSSLSRKINGLEDELGISLFYRDSHQVSLTEAGKEFYYDTLRYMESYYSAIKKARNIHDGYQCPLKIGIGLYEHDLLSPFLPDFVKAHPEIKFNCYQYSYMDVLLRFERKLLDIAITTDKYFNEFNLHNAQAHLIYDEPWVLAVNERDPLSELSFITREALDGKTIITISEGTTSQLLNAFRSVGNFKNVICVNTFHTKMLMINAGLGVGTIPEFVDTSAYGNIKKVKFGFLYHPRSFYLLYHKDTQNAYTRIFAGEYASRNGIVKPREIRYNEHMNPESQNKKGAVKDERNQD